MLSGLKEKQGFLFLFCSGFVFVYTKDVCVSEVYTFQLPMLFAVVILKFSVLRVDLESRI